MVGNSWLQLRVGRGHFFSSYTSVEVSSGEYRIHTAMMGRLTKGGRDEKEEERPVRNHWCVAFSVSLPSCTVFSLCTLVLHFTPAFPISVCCHFCVFLSSIFLVSHLSFSHSLSSSFLVVSSLGLSGKTRPKPDVITASQGEETGGRNMGS